MKIRQMYENEDMDELCDDIEDALEIEEEDSSLKERAHGEIRKILEELRRRQELIHIAPCSCELHQALREALERNAKLEAELALWKNRAKDGADAAEKAEEALKVYQDAEPIWRARVAELETEIKRLTVVHDTMGFEYVLREREAD